MITIEEFKKKKANKVRFVGLDLGSKRIGVSICDERQLIATPFKTIIKSNTNELICKKSRLAYPIRNNIPILLIEEAREITIEGVDEN